MTWSKRKFADARHDLKKNIMIFTFMFLWPEEIVQNLNKLTTIVPMSVCKNLPTTLQYF